MYQETFMRQAIALSAKALDTKGTEPFGAVVVQNGKIVGEGINRSLETFDPTSHGETEAIRDACKNLQTVDLRGCEIYTSCEPCALCVAAMAIAGITKMYYAANLSQSDAALQNLPETNRFPIDVDHLRHECGTPLNARKMPSQQALSAEAVEVLRAWAAQQQNG